MFTTVKHSENYLEISQRLGYKNPPISVKNVSGGCIHQAQIWGFEDNTKCFVKQNTFSATDVLLAENEALLAIYNTHTIRVPKPVLFHSSQEEGAFLVLEYMDLVGLDEESSVVLGKEMACLHRSTHHKFGFNSDNFIGATPQQNKKSESWSDFFWNQRLLYQIQLASKNGFKLSDEKIEALGEVVLKILNDREIIPGLLHGDLWGGNASGLKEGGAAVFDPASYYGDPEADIAFTEVFGVFPPEFYSSYKKHSRWDEKGYRVRKNIYNLYHYLNHFNLFGFSYHSSCLNIIDNTISQYG